LGWLVLIGVAFGVFILIGLLSSAKEAYTGSQIQSSLAERARALAPGYPVALKYVSEPVFNAFAYCDQNGTKCVAIYQGLLSKFGDDSGAIDFVIAHEISHHKHNHMVVQSIVNMLSDAAYDGIRPVGFFESLGLAAPGSTPPDLFSVVVKGLMDAGTQWISRKDEFEADKSAVEMMKRSNVDPTGAVRALQRIMIEEGSPGLFQALHQRIFGSHPLTQERIDKVAAQVGGSRA